MVRFFLIVCALLILLTPIISSDYELRQDPQFQEVGEVEKDTETEKYPRQEIGSQIAGKVTMYNSVPEQTDDTPFITASGQTVRKGIVANNCLPFGARVVIEGFIYEVQDRLNSKYGCEWFDIWSESIEEARAYGVQNHVVQIPVCIEDCPLIDAETAP